VQGGGLGYSYSRFEPDKGFGKRENGYNKVIKGGKRGVFFTGSVFSNDLLYQSAEGTRQFEDLIVDYALRDRREREITALRMSRPYRHEVLIETGELHTPMTSFRSCLGDLALKEGLDPDKLATLSRRPQPKDIQAWADQLALKVPLVTTYPTGFQVIEIRLTFDPSGKPIDCRLRDNLEDVNFYRSACKTSLEQAEFNPALDSTGKPSAGYYTTRLVVRGD